MRAYKKLISTIICVALLLSLLPAIGLGARAATVTYAVEGGNLYFDPNSGTVTACDAGVTAAEIPDEIQGVAVTAIGMDAFYTCDRLTRVSMGKNVTCIGDFAFYLCGELESVTMGSALTQIGEYAFSGCVKLKSVEIPEGVSCIGSYAFEDCMDLVNITVPDSVTSMGSMVFTNSGYSKEESNWVEGVLYIGNHLLEAKTSLSGEYTIRDKTVTVAGYAFRECKELTKLTIPHTVVSIYDFAFGTCSNLEEVYYTGTEEMWDAIAIGTSNEPLLNAKLYFASVQEMEIPILHSLELASDISVRYAVPVEIFEEYDSYYMECAVPQYEGNTLVGSTKIRLEGEAQGEYLYFVLDSLASTEMTHKVQARLYLSKDGESYVSQEDLYSIATYAYNQLNSTTAPRELKTVCANLLQYGAKVQIWKKHRTDALADGEMTEEHRSYLTDLRTVEFGQNKESLGDLAEPKVSFVGMPMGLNSRIVLCYVVDLRNYDGALEDLNLRITYTGIDGKEQTVTLTALREYYAPSGYYTFDFDGLLAAELRTILSAAVYEGDVRVSETTAYSPDFYGNGKTGEILTLMQALLAYSDSARRYFEA